MYKKLISSILVVALLNLVGCYTIQSVSVPEYKQVEKEEGKPDEIFVKTNEPLEYHFSDSDFYIEKDTLYGNGILLQSKEEITLEKKFAVSEIDSIQLYYFGQKYSNPVTFSHYQKIEAEKGEPEEIYLTKYDSTKHHFLKNDYYIENDTLFGKEIFLPNEKEQPFEGKIALSEIESFQIDLYDESETIWAVVSILLGITLIILIFVGFSALATSNK